MAKPLKSEETRIEAQAEVTETRHIVTSPAEAVDRAAQIKRFKGRAAAAVMARRASGLINIGPRGAQRQISDAEIKVARMASKRHGMTTAEEEIYAACTDDLTGIPPANVSGTWECCTISW